MTAYERFSQQTQLPPLAQPSPLLPDTFNVRWSASPNQVEHILPYPSSARSSTMQGSFGPTGVYTTIQKQEYVQQPQPRIYTHDGYFDSTARPTYHYDSPWEREGSTQYKQQQSAAPEAPVWSTSSEWVPAQSTSVGVARESSGQLDTHLTTFGSPVTSSAYHGHDHHFLMPNSANQSSLTEPMTRPIAITSNFTHFAHVAHQPIPPSQHSAYSELSVNLPFMERLEREERAAAAHRRQSLPAISTSTPLPSIAAAPSPATSLPSAGSSRRHERQLLPVSARAEGVTVPAGTTTYRGVHLSADVPSSPDLWLPTKLTFVDAAQTPSPPADAAFVMHSGAPARNTKEPKKPSLACTFCRERKIACGRPPEGSADPTCNQCARRSFTCKYVNEHPKNLRRSRKH
ncbi:hypothetical protein BJ912DRAFT_974407 [Pholiota molesta]|nr:hypothetical protein BJ912DRAFT_974407 [Pholiota molesta]